MAQGHPATEAELHSVVESFRARGASDREIAGTVLAAMDAGDLDKGYAEAILAILGFGLGQGGSGKEK